MVSTSVLCRFKNLFDFKGLMLLWQLRNVCTENKSVVNEQTFYENECSISCNCNNIGELALPW